MGFDYVCTFSCQFDIFNENQNAYSMTTLSFCDCCRCAPSENRQFCLPIQFSVRLRCGWCHCQIDLDFDIQCNGWQILCKQQQFFFIDFIIFSIALFDSFHRHLLSICFFWCYFSIQLSKSIHVFSHLNLTFVWLFFMNIHKIVAIDIYYVFFFQLPVWVCKQNTLRLITSIKW